MKKYLFLIPFILIGCGSDNPDGSSVFTYSSCKITYSNALFDDDRARDLAQCWNAEGEGYISQTDALQWCQRTVLSYRDKHYNILNKPSIKFAVESTYCPS